MKLIYLPKLFVVHKCNTISKFYIKERKLLLKMCSHVGGHAGHCGRRFQEPLVLTLFDPKYYKYLVDIEFL